ncbi:CD59B glycoprotein-like [Epinephelus fuscoguttatus]|uniref:CD59B glycoprotein-like n=1 Tax=Epinephelus fuscoguttatus TaxID=293821 RepID=UPI0020D001A0|nr:CD59B glycoprotein-like [Epinephelus fuscoguttatus]
MKFFGALILFMTLSAACGLRCYSCSGLQCADEEDCPPESDRCAVSDLNGYIARSCMISSSCNSPTRCCRGDLCNDNQFAQSNATPTASIVLLLLVSSAIVTLSL